MDTKPEKSKLLSVVKDLIDAKSWADNPVKVSERTVYSVSREQYSKILKYLESEGAIEIHSTPPPKKSGKKIELDGIDYVVGGGVSPKDDHFMISVLPKIQQFDSETVIDPEPAKIRHFPLTTAPTYNGREGILRVEEVTISISPKTLQGRILMHLLKKPGSTVGMNVIEQDMFNVDSTDNLTSADFKKAVHALNMRLRRALFTNITFISTKQSGLKINKEFYDPVK